MIEALEAIHSKQLNDVGNGEFTVTYNEVTGADADGHPIVKTGVLSCNPPDGHFTLMPLGSQGMYERCKIVGGSLVFAPLWRGPLVAYIVPYAAEIPND